MLAILLIGLVLTGVAVVLGARAIVFPRLQAVARIREIESYGSIEPELQAERDRTAVLPAFAATIGRVAGARMDLEPMRKDLARAGLYTVTPEAYLGYRVLGTLLFGGMVAAVLPQSTLPLLIVVVIIPFALAIGWIAPQSIVQARGRTRQTEIDRELPRLIDLLVVTIEAGLGFNAAQQKCSRRLAGPLGSEVRLALREQSMGLSTDQAMTNLLARCETDSVRSFVRSLQQGERLGVSIGTILRNLAVDIRHRQRQEAEERANKAPVKILFPLIMLIFPSLFIVLLGPAAFRLSEAFSGI